MLSDLAIPRTFTLVAAFYYVNCTQTVTAIGTALVGGKEFTAPGISFAFANPQTPLFITYTYSSLTIDSLTALEAFTIVRVQLRAY